MSNKYAVITIGSVVSEDELIVLDARSQIDLLQNIVLVDHEVGNYLGVKIVVDPVEDITKCITQFAKASPKIDTAPNKPWYNRYRKSGKNRY